MDSIIKKVKLPNSSTEYGINDVRISTSAISSPTHVLGYNSSNADTIGSVAITSISSTDTKNTAGATDSSAKLFLIGATTQGTNPQTYSQDTAYVGTDGCLYSGGNKVITDVSGKADLSSPAFTGTPTAPTATSGTNTTQIATTAFVNAAFQANDAMIFKGLVDSNSDLPATHYQGWTYIVGTAGTYDDLLCEVGDMLVCIIDGSAAKGGSSTKAGNPEAEGTVHHWAVILANLHQAVKAYSTSSSNHVVTYADNTGKLIKDSGYTIAKSVPSNAVFTDTTYKININGTDNGGGSTSLGTIYAPTTAGTSGYYLQSNGSGAPTWVQFPTIPSKISDVTAISVSAITADTSSTCSITGSSNAGKTQTIIYTNNSGSDKTVTVPTTYSTPDGAAIELTCPNGGYCEVNYLNISGTVYARGL